MTLTRQYIPAIGKSVKMREWSDYTSRNVNVWSWLRVHSINSDGITVQVLNGTEVTGQILNIPLSTIEPPIGWQSRYTIYAKPEQVNTVLGWFERGIVVRANHDMGSSMGSAFQPMDNSNTPHWRYPELTDAIPAELCPSIFRIIKFERQDVYDVYLVPDTDCKYCHGIGKRHLQTIADVREVSLQTILRDTELIAHLENYDSESKLFTCHCIRGGFSKLGRSKRAKLIKEWASDGWETHYNNFGVHGYWERTRETIVHDWQEN